MNFLYSITFIAIVWFSIALFGYFSKKRKPSDEDYEVLDETSRSTENIDGFTFTPGMQIIAISNSTSPRKGKLKAFNKKNNGSSLLPIVEYEDGNEYLCFGIIRPFDQKTFDRIKDLPATEAWNLYCKPHAKIEVE